MSADGVLTSGCPEKSASLITGIESALSSRFDTSLITVEETRNIDKYPTFEHVEQANGYICIGSGPMCVKTDDLARCDNPLCRDPRNDVNPCSCPNGVVEFLSELEAQISSLEASHILVEATATSNSAATTHVFTHAQAVRRNSGFSLGEKL